MDRIGLVGLDWDNKMDMENRAFRLERCSSYASKTQGQAIQALRHKIGFRRRNPIKGLSDQLDVPCCALRRRAAEYEADGADVFPGSGNPVANKDYGILRREREEEKAGKAEAVAIRWECARK